MPNHFFHLLVSTPEGDLSKFMRHFNITYTSAFNRRHGRVGHLYQVGRLVGGIDYSAVSQARKRLQIRLKQEPKLRKQFDKLSGQLLQVSRRNGLLPKAILWYSATISHHSENLTS
jgi:hypothetical protein